MNKIRIAVNGACGRMGRRILSLAHDSTDFDIVGAFEHEAGGHRGKKLDLENGLSVGALSPGTLRGKGVLIDFSGPTGTPSALLCARKAGWGLVIGTTGIGSNTETVIRDFAKKIPIVKSSNMSLGVNLMIELVRLAAGSLKEGFDIEITEAHHRHKKDAPSGTALTLAQTIANAKKWPLEKTLRYRIKGRTSERSSKEIGMQVIRAGEIVGDHTVLFAGPAETLEITHRAQSRDAFARGALLAAKFLSNKTKGLYTMRDVLRISSGRTRRRKSYEL